MPRRISRRVQRQFDVLRRATRWPVWADLATRLGVAFLLIGVVVLVHWSDRAGLQDSYDGHVGFLDVVYFTMISVTTTDRKSTRLNSVTNAHIVCRLLLEKKKQ